MSEQRFGPTPEYTHSNYKGVTVQWNPNSDNSILDFIDSMSLENREQLKAAYLTGDELYLVWRTNYIPDEYRSVGDLEVFNLIPPPDCDAGEV